MKNIRQIFNTVLNYIVQAAKTYFTREGAKKILVEFLMKYIGATGPLGAVVRYVVPKLVEWGIIEVINVKEKIQDAKTVDDFKKEISKPVDQIDHKKRDELEKDILTGR